MEKEEGCERLDLATVTRPTSPPPPLSPQSDHSINKNQEESFTTKFASLYDSIFPPELQFPSSLSLSPSPPSSSPAHSYGDVTTVHRLHQARLVLEYNELCDHYELCMASLQSLTVEIETLRHENAELRLANNDLLGLIRGIGQQISDQAVPEPCRVERRNYGGRTTPLPKSISVRSRAFLGLNQHTPRFSGPSRQIGQRGVLSQLGSGSVHQREYTPTGENGDKKAIELEVYRQGTVKTELCNKWEETGTCPYGEHCQFAHGIEELRPVIRHPRYKTQLCKMVHNGGTCPYGHRCHFRHSITQQERMLGPS